MFLIDSQFYIVKRAQRKGLGVYANKDIRGGVIIGDYLGKLLTSKNEKKYEKKYGLYSMTYDSKRTIFPEPRTQGVHLLNHSCEPNCAADVFKGHVLLFALRRIFKGEELTYQYDLDPFDRESRNVYSCRCGSTLCSGTMYANEKKIKLYNTSASRKYSKETHLNSKKELLPLKTYPPEIKDKNTYDLFGNSAVRPLILDNQKMLFSKDLREKIRKSGKRLYFKKIGILVCGLKNGMVIAKTIKRKN